MQSKRPKSSRRHYGLIFFASLIAALFLFRHALLETSVYAALRFCLPKEIARSAHYETVVWEEGKLVLSGVTVGDEHTHLAIDRLEVRLGLDLLHLYIEPRLLLVHPEVTLVQNEPTKTSSACLAALLPTKFYTLKLDIQNGVLQLGNAKELPRLYFAFQSGKEREQIGSFFLSYDPGLETLPLSVVDVSVEEKEPVFRWRLHAIESCRLMQLAGFFYPGIHEGWENVRGLVEVSGEGSEGRLHCQFDAHHLWLDNSQLGLHAKATKFQGAFSYPPPDGELPHAPIWKQVFATAELEDGELTIGEWGFRGVDAQLLLDPRTDPVLELKGSFLHGKEVYPLALQGKGAMHEDHSFWLEVGLKLAETTVGLVSVCSPEKETYIIQAEMEDLAGAHLQMLPVQLSEGLIKGKITAWIQGNQLDRVQFDRVTAEGVRLAGADLFLQQILVDGCLAFQGSSTLQLEARTTLGDLGLATDAAQEVTLLSTCSVKEGGYGLLGTVQAAEEKIEFGFDWNSSVNGGWLRAEKLTPSFYLPLVKKIYPEMNIEGDGDLFGTFDAKGIQLSLQMENLFIQHPAFDLLIDAIGSKDSQLLNTEGRAVFSYDWDKRHWYGMIPLEQCSAFDKAHDLHVEGITGRVQFDGDHFWMEEFSAQYGKLDVKGQLYVHRSASDVYELTLHTAQLSGEIESLVPLFNLFGHAPLASLQGRIESGEEGLMLSGRLAPDASRLEWKLKADLSSVSYPLNDKSFLSNLSTQLTFNSETGELALSQLGGNVQMGQLSYDLRANEVRRSGGKWTFDARLGEIASLVGRAEKAGSGMDLILDLEGCLGKLHTSVCYTEKGLTFTAEGKNLQILDKPVRVFVLKGGYVDKQGMIETLQLDDLLIRTSFTEQDGQWIFPDLELKSPQADLKATGSYDSHQKRLSGTLNPLHYRRGPLSATAEGPFSFDLATLSLNGEWNLSLAATAPLPFQAQSGGAMKVLLTKEGGLELCDIDLFVEGEGTAQCVAPRLHYDVQADKWMAEKLHFSISKEMLLGAVNAGIAPSFVASLEALGGVLDGEVSPSAKQLRIGFKGFELEGNWSDEGQFEGTLKGRNFEFLGYRFENLDTRLEFSKEHLLADQLVLQDEAGAVQMKQLKLHKDPVGRWRFETPLVQALEFRPSVLRPCNASPKPLKPLVIRTLSLQDFSGYLDDPSSYVGYGSFHFTNAFKKESNLFEVPLDLIKNLGLDPGLFTPIYGEVEILIKGGKCLITDLKNSYSDGKRSQFYLAHTTEPSYCDLTGKLHINLKMRQDVVMNITEPFMLSVRGSLAKPKYALIR